MILYGIITFMNYLLVLLAQLHYFNLGCFKHFMAHIKQKQNGYPRDVSK